MNSESWREKFSFLEYDYCHGVAHLERYSIILQIARNDTLWRARSKLGAQEWLINENGPGQPGFASTPLLPSMDSCRLLFCLVNVIIRGQIEIASRCCVAVYYAYYGLRKDEVKRENNFQRKRRFFFRNIDTYFHLDHCTRKSDGRKLSYSWFTISKINLFVEKYWISILFIN